MSDEAFKAELDRRWRQVTARRAWPCISLTPGHGKLKKQCRLQLPDGNITPEQVLSLTSAAEASGATVRIDLEHGIILYGPRPVQIPDEMVPMTTAPTIIACPGSTTCTRGLVNCQATAAKLRDAFGDGDFSGIRINISGCPNNCAQSSAAQIGLVGRLRKSGGKSIQHYQILYGGGNGKNNILAEPREVIPADKILCTIRELLQDSK